MSLRYHIIVNRSSILETKLLTKDDTSIELEFNSGNSDMPVTIMSIRYLNSPDM